MGITPHYDLDIDTSLGGNSASNYVISSQKAIKSYVDNNIGGIVDQIYTPTSANAQSGVAIAGAGFLTGITSSMVTSALGYTPYNSSNPNGYQANVIETIKVNNVAQTVTSKTVNITVPSAVTESTVAGWGFTKNAGTVTSVNNVSPVNGNVTLSIPTVDQTYTPTSANAQSGVAIAGAGFLTSIPSSYLQNTATGTNALTVGGYVSASNSGTNIGINSKASATAATALGNTVTASGSYSTAIGRSVTASANSAIQIGYGTNSTANTLSVGFYNNSTTHYNWQLLNGTTGLIPDDRLSTNIARSSEIPDTSNLANTDLNNLSATGEAVIDGQWVVSQIDIQTSATVIGGNTTKEWNIASGLPSDSYIYEVMFAFEGQTSATSGQTSMIHVGSDLINVEAYRCVAATPRNNAVLNYAACGNMIVGTGRKLKLRQALNYNTQLNNLRIYAYRRIGTNT